MEHVLAPPPATTRALLTDVGNDIPCRHPAVHRVGRGGHRSRSTSRPTVPTTPLGNIRRPERGIVLRSVLSRLPAALAQVADRAGEINDAGRTRVGVFGLSGRRGRHGFDPIHTTSVLALRVQDAPGTGLARSRLVG